MAKPKKSKVAVEPKNEVLAKLIIHYVGVDELKPNDYNPNRQSEHEFEMLLRSIEDDGFTQPIVVHWDSRTIVDGEHRWRACKALGYEEVPIVKTKMTPEQMRIATLRHNRARGSEDAALASDVLRQLIAAGEVEFAQDALMLDAIELERLGATVTNEDVDMLVSGSEITDAQLGPSGHGLTAGDATSGVDLTADERRAKEKVLAERKRVEEDQMREADKSFRLVLVFSGEDAQVVKSVLGGDAAPRLRDLCRARAAAAE